MKPPPLTETARGNGQVTTGQSFKNSPQDSDSSARFNQKSEQGAHAILQPRAERNAKILIALWMEEGLLEQLAFDIDNLPTEPLQALAKFVQESLLDGCHGFTEIAIRKPEYIAALADAAGLLSELLAKDEPPNIHTLRAELEAFHRVKSKQLLAWAEPEQQDEEPDHEEQPISPVESFFYDGTKYFLDAGHQYIPMDQRSVVRHLKNAGIKSEAIDRILCEIQVEKFISYAGPLAGHPRGLHISGGCRLLAIDSPEIIQPKIGQWPTIRAVLEGLLLDEVAGTVQLDTFLGWLKFARESLVSNRRRPGQAIALCGQRGSGKSLLLDLTELALGGRRANPYNYFTGRTNFNGDIAGAELLAVDDEAGSCDIRSRKTFAANIKSCLFSGSVRIEPKHRTAFIFRPVWRMLLALNDEPEALLVLPPITDDITDKISLLRCHKTPLPMAAHTLDEREAFFAKLRSELPALLDWLEKWEVPAELREERCGVTYYHHPELLASLHQLSPEGHLTMLVDTLAATKTAEDFNLPWTGTASELKAALCNHSTTAKDADKLLQSPNSTGTYLGRLEGSRVDRLPQHVGIQRWKFNSP